MLFIGNIEEKLVATKADLETFKSLKPDFDTLRGTRNHLLHGEIDNPTDGEASLCIKTALEIVPLFQSLDNEIMKACMK